MTKSKMKRLIVFDLDGTLDESKSSLDVEMSVLLHDLLGIVKVAVFAGGNDYPAREAGGVSIQVKDPNETKRIIETITPCLADRDWEGVTL
jgi:FMN phosphatase YigB (HAD superfamily)